MKGQLKPEHLYAVPHSFSMKIVRRGSYFVLPASRKPITASATKYKYQDHDDKDCLNAHS